MRLKRPTLSDETLILRRISICFRRNACHKALNRGLEFSAILRPTMPSHRGPDRLGAAWPAHSEDISWCVSMIFLISHILPFLTAAVQPAYEMGIQSARLLLSRLSGRTETAPVKSNFPHIIVRYSCGSKGQQYSMPLFEKSLSEERLPVEKIFPEQQRTQVIR
jgi:hypothetical protein